jgi:hypothetical protein
LTGLATPDRRLYPLQKAEVTVTTESTELTGRLTADVRRHLHKTALSLSVQIVGESSVVPTTIDVRVPDWAAGQTEIHFYFHRNVADLRQFRDEQMLTETQEDRSAGVYIEATRDDGDGVRVIAWTLLDADGNAAVAA